MPHNHFKDVPRRRLALMCFGLLWIGQGMHLWLVPQSDVILDKFIIHEFFPIGLRIVAWMLTGLLCILFSTWDDTEKTGWKWAMVMPIERTVSFFISGLMWIIPGWPPGAVNSFGESVYWGIVSLLIWVVAGIAEAPKEPS